MTELREADIFLSRGTGLLSRAIRFFTRRIGESRTRVNHVGIVVEGGSPGSAVVVEALSRVREHNLWSRYAPRSGQLVAVYRAHDMTPSERAAVVAKAREYRDRKYGYLKLVAHLLDWVLQGAYVFRRLTRDDRYPICSWLVAHAYGHVGLHFGVAPGGATPDDIWDWVRARTNEQFECVRPLGPLYLDR